MDIENFGKAEPCPHCGGDKISMSSKRRGNYRREGSNYQVRCRQCHARGPLVQEEPSVALDAWNGRVETH